jgi:hypothetical protein
LPVGLPFLICISFAISSRRITHISGVTGPAFTVWRKRLNVVRDREPGNTNFALMRLQLFGFVSGGPGPETSFPRWSLFVVFFSPSRQTLGYCLHWATVAFFEIFTSCLSSCRWQSPNTPGRCRVSTWKQATTFFFHLFSDSLLTNHLLFRLHVIRFAQLACE